MFKIGKSWYQLLKPEFEKPYYQKLTAFLEKEYNTKTIYPKPENVFNALNFVPPSNVKVVIIGQDPYHEPYQAHGLSFSVEEGVLLPPSLVNIFKELKSELGIDNKTGNLSGWAKQGVLLLNTVLTVERGKANSHKNLGWENLTTEIIKIINGIDRPVVFLLWGSQAQAFSKYLTNSRHLILKTVHPSPLSAYAGFFGCGHFLRCNQFLKDNGETEIDWKLQ